MRFIWIAAWKDLRILRREPFSVATWVGIPLCVGLLIQLVFSGGNARPQGVLMVADQDDTVASHLLTNAFSSEALAKMVKLETVDAASGHARIDRGDGSALLVIAPGLQDAFLDNRPYRLRLFMNAGQSILPNIIEQSLRTMVDSAFYVQRVGSSELHSFDDRRPLSDAEIAARAIETNHLSRELVKYVSPPLIEVDTVVEKEQKRNASAGDLFFPNLIFLSLMLMANGLSTDIWKERGFGTLRRVAVSPAPLGAFLAGRVVMVGLVYSVVAVAAVLAAKFLADVAIANLALAAAWAAVCGTLFYLLLLPMAATASGQRGADVRGNLMIFPLAMIGGCFFPFDVMPDWMARIGRFTPNGLAVVQFRDVLAGTAKLPSLGAVFAILASAAALAFAITVRHLRRNTAQ